MTCEQALDRMLEAEPSALRGDVGADPALAGHLRECALCRARAGVLASELEALDRGLDALTTTRAAGPSARRPSAAPPRSERVQRPAAGGPRPARALLPLAAAAVLASVLLLARPGDPPAPGAAATGDRQQRVGSAEQEATVAVTLAANQAGAVMRTMDPTITVVWLYERRER